MSITGSFGNVVAIKNYVDNNPSASAWDIVQHFKEIGLDEATTLAILREIYG